MLSAVFTLCVCLTCVCAGLMPDYMKVCNRDDPNVNECVRNNLQTLMPKFCDGVPEFDMPPLDPFVFTLGSVDFKQGNLYGKMLIKTSKAAGARAMRFTGVRANLKNPRRFEMDIDLVHPNLFLEGQYEAQGKLVVFHVNGSGDYNVSAQNLNTTWRLRGELVDVNQKQYMEIRKFDMSTDIGSLKLYASNMLSGNKEINKAILRFINKSWKTLHRRLSPFISTAFDRTMKQYANKVFLRVPYNQLFPTNTTETESPGSAETEPPESLDLSDSSNFTEADTSEFSEILDSLNDTETEAPESFETSESPKISDSSNSTETYGTHTKPETQNSELPSDTTVLPTVNETDILVSETSVLPTETSTDKDKPQVKNSEVPTFKTAETSFEDTGIPTTVLNEESDSTSEIPMSENDSLKTSN